MLFNSSKSFKITFFMNNKKQMSLGSLGLLLLLPSLGLIVVNKIINFFFHLFHEW